jgi:hypothetical protein
MTFPAKPNIAPFQPLTAKEPTIPPLLLRFAACTRLGFNTTKK